jgi:hypothetical protein
MAGTVKKYAVELTEVDIEILLSAIGAAQMRALDAHRKTKPYEIITNKVYRAMGVKLDSPIGRN